MKYFPLREQQRYSKNWWLQLLWGCALIIMGLFLLFWPRITGTILINIVGSFLFIDGIFDLIGAISNRTSSGWIWLLISGILGILAGLLIFAYPLVGTTIALVAVYFITGIAAIMKGLFKVIGGQRDAKRIGKTWSWNNFLVGIVEMLIGLFLLLNPLLGIIGLLALLVLAGPIAIIIGVFLLVRALRGKQVTHTTR